MAEQLYAYEPTGEYRHPVRGDYYLHQDSNGHWMHIIYAEGAGMCNCHIYRRVPYTPPVSGVITFVPTGDVRVPKHGEWYIVGGNFLEKKTSHDLGSFPIYRRINAEQWHHCAGAFTSAETRTATMNQAPAAPEIDRHAELLARFAAVVQTGDLAGLGRQMGNLDETGGVSKLIADAARIALGDALSAGQ